MDCLVCGRTHPEEAHSTERGHLRIAPVHVARWPWGDDVVHLTWRDTQESHFSQLRRGRNGKRLALLAATLILVFSTAWVTI